MLTTGGRVAGSAQGRLSVFKGIPYAVPPTGPLRWQAPQPMTPWSGTRDATTFGPAGPQVDGPPNQLPFLDAGPTDESCLTLNVWAPTGAHDAPVLVWIHGGAFLSGSTAVTSYDCARLADRTGAVVVSINYRLGALGFAPLDGIANLGLLDQLLALTWVRDNVEAFGGDPATTTVFGESAGGGSILHLLSAPAGRGLIRRAIVQSGATTLTLTADQALDVADRMRHALADGGSLATAHTASVGEILGAQARVGAELIPLLGAMPFHPAVDGTLVPARPAEALRTSDVALLIGTTAQELNLYADPSAPALQPGHLTRRAARYLPNYGVADPERVLAAYADLPGTSAVWASLRTDAEMWLPAVSIAESHGAPAFAYRFDWPAAPPLEWLGACHAIDIPFTFGTFDQVGWGDFVGRTADGRRPTRSATPCRTHGQPSRRRVTRRRRTWGSGPPTSRTGGRR